MTILGIQAGSVTCKFCQPEFLISSGLLFMPLLVCWDLETLWTKPSWAMTAAFQYPVTAAHVSPVESFSVVDSTISHNRIIDNLEIRSGAVKSAARPRGVLAVIGGASQD